MKKWIERLITAAGIAILVGIFCYQVAYGMSETVTNGNITATVTAPPGSIVNNFTIRPENRSQSLELTDASSIWTIVNSTSGSRGTIVFYTSCHEVSVKGTAFTCETTFHRFLDDRDLKGTVPSVAGINLVIEKGEPLTLCYGHVLHPYIKDYTLGPLKRGCFNLNPTILTRGHIQFKDMHGGTIDLWPAIPYPPDVTIQL